MTVRQLEPVLGIEVDRITTEDLIARVSDSMLRGDRLWVGHHNLHSAYLVLEDPRMRRWNDSADLVFADGMSLVAASRLSGGRLRRAHRSTLLDWMPSVLDAAAAHGKVVFHLGGDPRWIDRGAAAWRERHPGLRLHLHHGFFTDSEADDVVDEINRASPDLVLVGMGMPQQERWAAEHAARLDAPVIVTVGAFLGYAAGASSAPPRWVGQIGLEWAWRLLADPRRLARRYLVEPLLLFAALRRRRATGRSARRAEPPEPPQRGRRIGG